MPLPTHVLPSSIIHVPYIKAEPNEEAVGFTVTYICRPFLYFNWQLTS